MKTNQLGKSGIEVSQICLGTMTWGGQNSEAEGHAQMDYALDQGVNFFDTAELYAIPPTADTYGATERIIGTWFAARRQRDQVIRASKAAGGGNDWIRDGAPLTGASVIEALDGSLARLQTDYIDLYQIHWPDRPHYHFRRQWAYDPSGHDTAAIRAQMEDVLQALAGAVEAGKIRQIGLSNETAWGVMQYLQIARANGWPEVVSTQNEYSLMHRIYDLDLAEVTATEGVGLLAYSPIAAGYLSGKYRNGEYPEGSRGAMQPTLGGRLSETSRPAMEAYCALAEAHGMAPALLANAFVLTRPFLTSSIIGATSMEQLKLAISAADVSLDDEVMDALDVFNHQYPMTM